MRGMRDGRMGVREWDRKEVMEMFIGREERNSRGR